MYITISSAAFRRDLSAHVLDVQTGGRRVLITRNGRDVAALVSVRDLDALERVERSREDLMEQRHARMLSEFRALKDGVSE